MIIQKTKYNNIEDVMKVINQAKQYFIDEKIFQWCKEYPAKEHIKNDIDKDESYIVLDNDKIVATFVLSVGKDVCYEKIYDGKWITDDIYATIHRVAIHNDYKRKGIGNMIIKYREDYCKNNNINSIRIDTHRLNLPMTRLIENNNFTYCGIIKTQNNDDRIAYEKIIEK